MHRLVQSILAISLCLTASICIAATKDFTKGPVFKNHGENALIDGGIDQPATQNFKVVFDISNANDTDKPHRSLNSVARFINMHVRAGVPLENIEVAVVVHGKASFDLMNQTAYKDKFNKLHPSSGLLNALLKENVQVYLCGQSAAYHGVKKAQLNSGVTMSLSAMTANALLQQQGYTLNPF